MRYYSYTSKMHNKAIRLSNFVDKVLKSSSSDILRVTFIVDSFQPVSTVIAGAPGPEQSQS